MTAVYLLFFCVSLYPVAALDNVDNKIHANISISGSENYMHFLHEFYQRYPYTMNMHCVVIARLLQTNRQIELELYASNSV